MKASVGCYTNNISSRNMTLSIPLKIFPLKRFHFDPPQKNGSLRLESGSPDLVVKGKKNHKNKQTRTKNLWRDKF